MTPPLDATYLLPLKATRPEVALMAYVRGLTSVVAEVIVVDSSPEAVFRVHAERLDRKVVHLRPDVDLPMGKVANVRTGLEHARHDRVVIADDDVRWDGDLLAEAVAALDRADVVRPANHFRPSRWHTRWDTGRTLIARATGGDWPGTMLVRRSALPAEGYAGDCLFENLELVRTVRAGGGQELVLHGVVVPRDPPTTRKFLEQRVRQAYDELARPPRFLLQLAVAPILVLGRRRAWVALTLGSVGVAELGRRRAGGTRVWPWTAALWAPAWVLERSVTSWLALGQWLRGGARFGGVRLRRAAHSQRELARALEEERATAA
ncbi:MAG: glycosyltransferase [Acidimicrobiales bacterium]